MDDRFLLREVDTTGECARVIGLVRAELPGVDVSEVGSTAVPGVIGKGDLDLLVRVPLGAFVDARAALDRLFPRNPDQLANDQYQGYLVPAAIDVAIQLTVSDGPYDSFHAFLAALRADPGLVEAYNALKRAHDGAPMDVYRRAKAAFIEEVLAR